MQGREGAGENARLAGAVKDRKGLGEGGWCLFPISDVEWCADSRVDHDATSIIALWLWREGGEAREAREARG